MDKGEYPFSMQLPDGIPCSYQFMKDKNLKARITYEIWAGLMNKKKGKYFFTKFEIKIGQRFKQDSIERIDTRSIKIS